MGTMLAATAFAASFTSDSTIYAWRGASASYEKEYCELMAKAQEKLAPGINKCFLRIRKEIVCERLHK